ncbi:MAG: hypothetical protein HOK35_00290 [Cytophagia bacterium]|nr:hypothetical protein [Cytophagia bacterium]
MNPLNSILCIGQDFHFYAGGVDSDKDSLGNLLDSISYEWTDPLTAAATPVSYNGQYSYTKPIYYWGFPNSYLPFPRGFHLDPLSGGIGFRPMKIENTVASIMVKEWRKINGITTLIGQTQRDFHLLVTSCPNNNAPVLSGPYYKEVCAEDTVIFSITSNDNNNQDSLLISYQGNIPGASWTDSNYLLKHPNGQFVWVPSEQDASSIPYVFYVTVTDDACPLNSSSTQAYQILVKPLPKVDIILTDSGCGNYMFHAQAISGHNPSYLWTGSFNPVFAKFGPTMQYTFNKPGIYPYSLKVDAQLCSSLYVNTLVVDTFITANLMYDLDICYGDTAILSPKFLYNTDSVAFTWSTGDSSHILHYPVYSDITLSMHVLDTNVCVESNEAHINMHNLPQVNLGADIHLCNQDTGIIQATYSFDQGLLQTLWWTNSKTGFTVAKDTNLLMVSDSGKWTCFVQDTLGCIGKADVEAFVNPEIKAMALGDSICPGEIATLSAQLTGSKSSNVQYWWYDKITSQVVGISSTIHVSPSKTTDYKLLVKENSAGILCSDSTFVRIVVHAAPVIHWYTQPKACIDGGIINLNDYVWTNPINSPRTWTSPSSGFVLDHKFDPQKAGSGSHKVVLTVTSRSTSCSSKDSAFVTLHPKPKADAGKNATICSGDGNYNLNGLPASPPGIWRSIAGFGIEGSPGNYYFNPNANGVSDGMTYPCIYLYIDSIGCSHEDTVVITVYQSPVVNAGDTLMVDIKHGVQHLMGTPVGGSWSGPGVSSNKFNPVAVGLGMYELTYSYTNVICKDEDTLIGN